jgi:predicted secreted Zn-dependent protease
MNLNVTIDWKFVVALGTAVVGTIFAVKMDADVAERVSTHAVDACKEYAIAGNSGR